MNFTFQIFAVSGYARFWLLALFCIVQLKVGYSQEPPFWQYTDEDGLSSMTIYQVLQDKKGFIWLGTASGICKFDGVDFKSFDNPLLLDKEFLLVKEDMAGTIWAINLSGQLCYVENDSLKLFESPANPKLKSSDFHILSAQEKIIFYESNKSKYSRMSFISDDQLTWYDSKDQVLLLNSILINNEELLISRPKNLMGFSLKDKKFIQYEELNPLMEETYYKISPYKKDKILVFNHHEAQIYDLKTKISEKVFEAKDKVISSISLIKNQIWVTTSKGAFKISDSGNSFEPKQYFKDFDISCIIQDVEGNYWIGTIGKGLLLAPGVDLDVFNNENSTISDDQIYSIFKSKSGEDLWLGLSDGRINKIDPQNKIQEINLPINGRILFIKEYQDFIIAGGDGGCAKYQKAGGNKSKWLERKALKCLLIDKQDNFIFGRMDALIPLANNSFSQLLPDDRDLLAKFNISKNLNLTERIYSIYEDYEGMLWIGTTRGLFQFENDEVKPFIEKGEHKNYRISAIIQTPDSIIWVSTHGNGLLGIKNNKLQFTFNVNNGFSSNACNNLFFDGLTKLWVGTDNGVNILELNTFNIAHLDKTNGLPINEIISIYVDSSEAWIGTSKGLVNLPLKSLNINDTPPPIHITNFKIWQKDTAIQENYFLDYQQNNLQIEFIGLAYRMKGKVKYQFRLLGLDSSWTNTDFNFASYPILNPGSYEFQVLAVNEDGIKSRSPAKIKFEILPPFWQTWWFRLGSIAVVLSLLWFIFYLRFKSIQKREREQQDFQNKVNELRMQALQTQMNPHFIFNALNAIQQFITTNDQETAMIYLARFARLIRLIFEHSKKKEISLEEELEFLKLYLNLEKLRFGDKVDVQLKVNGDVEVIADDWKLPPLLIQPIVENSFKHGLLHKKGKGKISILFEEESSFLKCTIEDDGVGRKRSQEINTWRQRNHQSSGLKSTKERLEILAQNNKSSSTNENFRITDLFDGKKQAIGTRVEIYI